jgi:hypothetical protein
MWAPFRPLPTRPCEGRVGRGLVDAQAANCLILRTRHAASYEAAFPLSQIISLADICVGSKHTSAWQRHLARKLRIPKRYQRPAMWAWLHTSRAVMSRIYWMRNKQEVPYGPVRNLRQ